MKLFNFFVGLITANPMMNYLLMNEVIGSEGDSSSNEDLLMMMVMSPGPDGLTNKLLIEGTSILARVFVRFFSLSINLGCIPSDWKVPSKKDSNNNVSRHDLAHFRPILHDATFAV